MDLFTLNTLKIEEMNCFRELIMNSEMLFQLISHQKQSARS